MPAVVVVVVAAAVAVIVIVFVVVALVVVVVVVVAQSSVREVFMSGLVVNSEPALAPATPHFPASTVHPHNVNPMLTPQTALL